MRQGVFKRSVMISGRKTSVSLEDAFWHELAEIARARKVTIATLVADIVQQKRSNNLSSAIRLFVLSHLRAQSTAESAATQVGTAKDDVPSP
jgi:predicted DNA-binding ribbon-helix-helix protein